MAVSLKLVYLTIRPYADNLKIRSLCPKRYQAVNLFFEIVLAWT